MESSNLNLTLVTTLIFLVQLRSSMALWLLLEQRLQGVPLPATGTGYSLVINSLVIEIVINLSIGNLIYCKSVQFKL